MTATHPCLRQHIYHKSLPQSTPAPPWIETKGNIPDFPEYRCDIRLQPSPSRHFHPATGHFLPGHYLKCPVQPQLQHHAHRPEYEEVRPLPHTPSEHNTHLSENVSSEFEICYVLHARHTVISLDDISFKQNLTAKIQGVIHQIKHLTRISCSQLDRQA